LHLETALKLKGSTHVASIIPFICFIQMGGLVFATVVIR